MAKDFERYGLKWPSDTTALEVELFCIKHGGRFDWKEKKNCGMGLFHHFMEARKLAWPKRYHHRWVELVYQEIINNMVTILMGPFSCGKTSIACEYVLLDYWASPDNTMVLCSTTSTDKLNSGVFSEIKMLFKEARERHDNLPGNPLEHKNAITTDELGVDTDMREMRKGIFGKACYVGARYVGLGVFSGLKQERIRFLNDELQFMPSTFYDSLPNIIGSATMDKHGEPQVKIIGSGNPKHDPFDMLGIAAEPENGWQSIGLVDKTTVWNTRFHRGRCVNLIGTDSPNFDYPETEPIKFPKLINRNNIKIVEKTWDRNSLKFNEQCIGRMMIGMAGNRVITKDLCRNNHAFDEAQWLGMTRTKVGGVDPAWSEAGDRCVWMWGEFGEGLDGNHIFRYGGHNVIPIVGGVRDEPDNQIAAFVKDKCTILGIQPDNVFYGSTGRGTTGAAFAKVFGHICPVPIAEGGKASLRPVREDFWIQDEHGNKRLKRCDEEYSKFITELWFAVRNLIECGQMRELPNEIAEEGCLRKYELVSNGRVEIEPKEDLKERVGYSTDLFDCLTFCIEGARQRGIKIKRLGGEVVTNLDGSFFVEEADQWKSKLKSQLLER